MAMALGREPVKLGFTVVLRKGPLTSLIRPLFPSRFDVGQSLLAHDALHVVCENAICSGRNYCIVI